jgi:hypothetical protein
MTQALYAHMNNKRKKKQKTKQKWNGSLIASIYFYLSGIINENELIKKNI